MTFEEYVNKSIREFKKKSINERIAELEKWLDDDEKDIKKLWKYDSERYCFLYKSRLERKQELEWMQSLKRLARKERTNKKRIASLESELNRYKEALKSACRYEQYNQCEDCRMPECDKDCKNNGIKRKMEFYLGGRGK